MRIQRCFVSIFSDQLEATRDFFVKLLNWEVDFDSTWFVHLKAPGNDALELGVLLRDQEIIPEPLRQMPAGAMLTVVVPDVDQVYARAKALDLVIIEPPRDLFYGQRRMLITDPNGMLVDISSECAPADDFLASTAPTN